MLRSRSTLVFARDSVIRGRHGVEITVGRGEGTRYRNLSLAVRPMVSLNVPARYSGASIVPGPAEAAEGLIATLR